MGLRSLDHTIKVNREDHQTPHPTLPSKRQVWKAYIDRYNDYLVTSRYEDIVVAEKYIDINPVQYRTNML